jgi:hypothetical protein
MKKQNWSRILAALSLAFAATAFAVPIGVTVNSVHLNDDASIDDPNWTYNSLTGVLRFHGSGSFMVSGTNTAGKARIVIPNGVTNTVRIWNLNLQTPGDGQCIFALEANASVSLILKGTNTLASGKDRAGIEVPASASLSIARSSADPVDRLIATGGDNGAGIGGGKNGDGGTVIVNSSIVEATGGGNGAGIGGGGNGKGGALTINGGTVTATGGSNGAGVGGGNGGKGGNTSLTGGTLFAQGKSGGADIGKGSGATTSGANTFTGGAIHLANNSITTTPTDGANRVWRMTVTNLTPYASIVVTGLAPYGMNDLAADSAGKLHLWLPNGGYSFTAGGGSYAATIDDANATAALSAMAPPSAGAYLTFSSANAFTINPQQKTWNGTLYWSTDTTFWSVFTASGATAAPDNGAGEYKLHLCGSGNTYITGSSTSYPWLITAGNPVACTGNIETLLDHATVAAGEHPTMASCCFAYLFRDCAALASTPSLPATTLANHCYYNLFNGCTSLTSAPELPATILPERCYNGMFNGCTSLTQAPVLRATNLAESCYGYMFHKCSGLTSAPALPATTLADYCYHRMFYGCTGLTSAPALPATTLAPYCYNRMFYDCIGLTSAPTLPATTLAERCYEYMFRGCTGLTQAPALPATNLADYCYANMFNRCTGLTRAPALPAATLAERCYNGMFTSCTGLTNTPTLPATTLAPYCYYYMFQSCTGLKRLPELPAVNLAEYCYGSMFYKCSGIKLNADGPGMAWKIPGDAVAATNWSLNMLADTSGTFTGDPAIGTTYHLASGLPATPVFATDGTGFAIGDGTATLAIVNAESGLWYTLYWADSLGAIDWHKAGSLRATGSELAFTTPLDTATVPRRFYRIVPSLIQP